MTDQEINIAIAEVCGWYCNSRGMWFKPPKTNLVESTLPDYCHDLNAMHEAEMTLDNVTGANLIEELCKLRRGWENNTRFDLHVRATSRQRAEAFLRVKGLWKETT